MMPSNTYVLYHANCPDGFTAAWVAWRSLGASAKYIPCHYPNTDAPKLKGPGKVYVLDFSFPVEQLVAWAHNDGLEVVLLDHHKTAKQMYMGANFGDPGGGQLAIDVEVDLKRSGAQMTWDHFFPGMNTPSLVQYVQDRDLWLHQLPDSKEINAWIMSYDYDFTQWSNLEGWLKNGHHRCRQEGEAILRYKQRDVRMMLKQAYTATMPDAEGNPVDVPVVNATSAFSEVGNELAVLNPTAPFAAYWYMRQDGKKQWGLRSLPGKADVALIATKWFGGGGHPNAAGFVEG